MSRRTVADHRTRLADGEQPGAVLGKKYLGAWPLIIWEATTAKRNYYKTNYIKHVEKNNPEKI